MPRILFCWRDAFPPMFYCAVVEQFYCSVMYYGTIQVLVLHICGAKFAFCPKDTREKTKGLWVTSDNQRRRAPFNHVVLYILVVPINEDKRQLLVLVPVTQCI